MDDLSTDQTTTFLVHHSYSGSAAETAAALAAEQPALAASGYQVVDQSWEPGHRPWWWWLVAVLLVPLLVGIALLVYLLLNPPPGRLTVTLTWTGFPETPAPGPLLQPGAAPAPDTQFTEGEPFSLVGLVVDAGGRSVEERALRWTIDGEVVAEGTRLAGVDRLPGGEHVVHLGLATDAPLIAASTSIIVGPADEATVEWRRAAELAERIAVERGLRA